MKTVHSLTQPTLHLTRPTTTAGKRTSPYTTDPARTLCGRKVDGLVRSDIPSTSAISSINCCSKCRQSLYAIMRQAGILDDAANDNSPHARAG